MPSTESFSSRNGVSGKKSRYRFEVGCHHVKFKAGNPANEANERVDSDSNTRWPGQPMVTFDPA
jgi:hypothetical protein